MYVVLLNCTAPEKDIDEALPDHYDWITEHYESGDFLVAGRRRPRDGAVILARAMSRGRLDAILATDPFVARKLVRYEVIHFQALRSVPELAKYSDVPAHVGE